MSLEYNKETLEWRKRAFECEPKITNGIKNQNDMKRIHDDKVNKRSE